MKIIFASNNRGKIRELNALFKNLNMTLIPQSELNVAEVPETAVTFVENALIKARHASSVSGLPAIADDSGLCVDALSGEPGVFSARYAGEKASAKDNIDKLLQKLREIPDEKRTAAFHCVLVYLHSPLDPMPIICHAAWQGVILRAPQGEEGFGYDPIFFDPTQKCSAAELSLEIKNQISHRGKALKMLLERVKCDAH